MANNNYTAAKKQGRTKWLCPRCKEYYDVKIGEAVNTDGTEICAICLAHEINRKIPLGPNISIDITMSLNKNQTILKKLKELLDEELQTDCTLHYDGDAMAWVFKED
jgi:transposase-like protein